MTSEPSQGMIDTDDYGRVPYRTFRFMKSKNVSPADWDSIRDAYELIARSSVDFRQAERFILKHSPGGVYVEPWPMNPLAIFQA